MFGPVARPSYPVLGLYPLALRHALLGALPLSRCYSIVHQDALALRVQNRSALANTDQPVSRMPNVAARLPP